MGKVRNTRQDEVPVLLLNNIRPHIEFFFSGLTAEQWRQMTSGSTDDATRIMLADMLLDLITSLTTSFMATLDVNTAVTEEHVRSSLGNTLPQTFADVLEISDRVRSRSSDQLMELVGREVKETVNSVLSSGCSYTEPSKFEHITPPSRLNEMVTYLCNMFKSFKAKIKKMSLFQERKQFVKMEDLYDLEDYESELFDGGSLSSGSMLDRSGEILAEDSFLKATSETVQKTISKEVSEFMEPLLQVVPVSHAVVVLSETSEKIKSVVEEISPVIAESSAPVAPLDPSPKPRKNKLSLRTVSIKIKTFITKCFAKVLLLRKHSELKLKFSKDSRVEDRKELQVVIASVDALLGSLDGEKGQGEPDFSQSLQRISEGKDQVFVEALISLLIRLVTLGWTSEDDQEPVRGCQQRLGVSGPDHENVRAEVEKKVRSFLILLHWWLNTQVDGYCQRVTHTLTGTKAPTPATTPAENAGTPEEERAQQRRSEQNQTYVRTLVELLLWRALKKTNMTLEDRNLIIERLSEATWAQLEGLNLNPLDLHRLKDLSKTVLKDLCRRSGSLEMMLLSLYVDGRAAEELIVSLLVHHLTASAKKNGGASTFCLSVRKVLLRPFRGGSAPRTYSGEA